MKRFGQFVRLTYINYIMARYGFDRVILSAPAFSSWRFLSYLNPWNWVAPKAQTRGEALRLVLESLGPIFVKFGQILSTRRDLLPDDIIDELEKLQDNVPPFSGEKACAIIEEAYGCTIATLFAEFDLMPLASASISQVHAAQLKSGQKVVVKVLRPNIQKIIQRDIALLYSAAQLTERFWSHGKRLRPRELVAEFEKTLIDELDLFREASNASQLRRNFLNSPVLYVPEIYWPYARRNVLIMERIRGIPVSDVTTLHEYGIDLKKLAERGVEIFFTQVFRDSFFHADMHPGNIFVSKAHPQDPQYIAVDFGIMGTLSPFDQRYLAENLLAFFKRDYRRVAMLHVKSGWVPRDTRIEDFESAIRCVCEPIFEKPLKEISFGQLLVRLFQTASRFHMEVQPQLLLLQKTLLNIEGLGRQLYPDLDLWVTAKPYLERWLQQRYSVRGLLRNARERMPYLMAQLSDYPDLIQQSLERIANYPRPTEEYKEKIEKSHKKHSRIQTKFFLLGFGLAGVIWVLINMLLANHSVPTHADWLVVMFSFVLVAIAALLNNKNN